MKQGKSIRSVRFGLRFKFSLILGAAVVFVAVMIGLLAYTQYTAKIRDEILRLGSTILNGTREDAGTYLRTVKMLRRPADYGITPYRTYTLSRQSAKALKGMADYFASIVVRESILDIAYCIVVDWKDVSTDWRHKYSAEYLYFARARGDILQRGWEDRLLKPSIYAHYMNSPDTGTYITYSGDMVARDIKFVIVGMPVYNTVPVRINGRQEELYTAYNAFMKRRNGNTRRPPQGKDDLIMENKTLHQFEQLFIKRLVENRTSFNYSILLNTPESIAGIARFLAIKIFFPTVPPARRTQLITDLTTGIRNSVHEGRTTLEKVKGVVSRTMKSYAVYRTASGDERSLWQQFYYFLVQYKIPVTSPVKIKELALTSFRKDLNGIIGVFFKRSQFFSEMRANTSEMINLIVSILIRCIIIALFFPTFIIRTVSRLAEGAYEIERGNLDVRLKIPGTDELGRLSDIFNHMSAGLKKGQEAMIEKKRMEKELQTAREIQSALLPGAYPVVKNIDFGAHYEAQTESGGDYYDFIELGDGRLGVAIADVSGHGVGPGLVMAMARTLLHTHCGGVGNPKDTLEKMNLYLYENTDSIYFVSMFYGILDPNTCKLSYTSAGHLPALVVRDKQIKELKAGGIALGTVGNSIFSRMTDTVSFNLKKGDYFVLYTDGIIEAMNGDNNEYGAGRFHAALLSRFGRPAGDMIKGVISSVEDFTGKTPQHDDITMVVLRIL